MYKGEILVGSYFLTRQVHTPSIDKNWIRRDTLEVFVNTQKQLYEYFSGSREDFTINYKLEGNNSQLKVWSALTEIRYGRTSNYKQIAHNIKEPKAIRRVANTSRTLFFMQRFHWIFIYLALKGTLTSSYYKL